MGISFDAGSMRGNLWVLDAAGAPGNGHPILPAWATSDRWQLDSYKGSTVEEQNDVQTFAQATSSTANVLNVQPASSLRFAPGLNLISIYNGGIS